MMHRNTRGLITMRSALVVLSSALVVAACESADPTAPIDPVSIETTTLAAGIEGQGYSQQLAAAGGGGGYSWVLTAGSLPSGLTLSPGGMISGTPVGAGTSTFRVQATDSGGRNATANLSIPVIQALSVHTWTLPDATVGDAYAAQVQAVGGTGTFTWSLTGEAASWLTVSPTGTLSGTPATSGASTVTVAIADASGQQATRQLALVVRASLAVADLSLPAATQGRAFAAQLVATGGTGAYSWSVTEGALPAGLTLSSSGAISGTPTSLGSSSFTVRVTDAAGATHTRAFTVVVARIVTLANGVAVTDIGGAAGSIRYFSIEVPAGTSRLTVATSGGTGDVDLYLRRGALPQEFAYDCRPFRPGAEETCSIASPAVGTWYIMLRGYSDHAGVTLVATVEG